MELRMVWIWVRRWWWLIALPAAVALLVTLPSLGSIVSPAVSYQVQMRLSAAAPPDLELEGITTPYEDSAYVPLLASEYVVANLPAWITGDFFAREVREALASEGVVIADDALQGVFHADGLRGILTLYVSWDDPVEIRAIADAAITVLQTRNQTYFAAFAAQPVRVVPLDDIVVAEVAPPIAERAMPLLRVAIGLAAGVALAALAAYMDEAVYNRADVEATGLTVMGEIPRER
jgi:hypothetical protein